MLLVLQLLLGGLLVLEAMPGKDVAVSQVL
jgi:hypothetical protein